MAGDGNDEGAAKPSLHRWAEDNAEALGKTWRLPKRERTFEGVLEYMRLLNSKGRLWYRMHYQVVSSPDEVECCVCSRAVPAGDTHVQLVQSLVRSARSPVPRTVAALHRRCAAADARGDAKLYRGAKKVREEVSEAVARHLQVEAMVASEAAARAALAAAHGPADPTAGHLRAEDLPAQPRGGKWYPMVVEAAKSGRGLCKRCGEAIPQGTLKLYDSSTWQLSYGRLARYGGEGTSRGYFEMPDPRYDNVNTISRKGVPVHLACYEPMHPREAPFFLFKSKNAALNDALEAYIAAGQPEPAAAPAPARARARDEDGGGNDDDDDAGRRPLNKRRRRR